MDAAKTWMEHQDEVPLIPHLTHHALCEVLDSVNTWKNLSPEEIRARAVEIASNGVLKTARHDGKPSFGLSLGQHIKNRISNIQPSLDQLFGARFAAMLMDVDNHDQVRSSIQSEALADIYDRNIQSLMGFGMSKKRSTFNSLADKILPSQWKARLNSLSKHMKPRLERVKSQIDSHAGLAEEIRQDREVLKEFLQSGNPEAPAFNSILLLGRVSERREQISQSFPNSRAPRVS